MPVRGQSVSMTGHIFIAFILVVFSLSGTYGLNILIITLVNTKSIAAFNERFACTLAEHGHNITLVNMVLSDETGNLKVNCNLTIYDVFPSGNMRLLRNHMKLIQEWTYGVETNKYIRKLFTTYEKLHPLVCDEAWNRLQLVDRLAESRLDLAIVHPFDYCPAAIVDELRIPALRFSCGNYVPEWVAEFLQTSYMPSYIPGPILKAGTRMSFLDRLSNTINAINIKLMIERPIMVKREMNIINPVPDDPSMKSYRDLAYESTSLFINGDILLDFPRPLSMPFHYLGALPSITNGEITSKDLSSKWISWFDDSKKGVIIFSFGSVLDTSLMPQSMKAPFIDAFCELLRYQILWKVNEKFVIPSKCCHITLTKWMPQKLLLRHPNVKLFITHGGYNSLLEAAEAGVPLITVPLNLDQYGNAKRAERLGFSLVLDKTNLSKSSILASIAELLSTDRYEKRAKALSAMLNDRPISSDQHFVFLVDRAYRRREILKKFTQLPELSLIRYFNGDIIVVATFFSTMTLALITKLILGLRDALLRCRISQ